MSYEIVNYNVKVLYEFTKIVNVFAGFYNTLQRSGGGQLYIYRTEGGNRLYFTDDLTHIPSGWAYKPEYTYVYLQLPDVGSAMPRELVEFTRRYVNRIDYKLADKELIEEYSEYFEPICDFVFNCSIDEYFTTVDTLSELCTLINNKQGITNRVSQFKKIIPEDSEEHNFYGGLINLLRKRTNLTYEDVVQELYHRERKYDRKLDYIMYKKAISLVDQIN